MTEALVGVSERARVLEAWGWARRWTGSDPYDGLNAKRTCGLTRGRLGRRLLTQAVKRSPLDLRPMLAIAPRINAAAVATVLSAYARGGFLPDNLARERRSWAFDTLRALRSESRTGACWGYPFPVQTGILRYPANAPNTIATSFAGHALMDVFERFGSEEHLQLAVETSRFFVEEVPQTADAPGGFFGYLLGDRTPIHNANVLVGALLARVAGATGDEPLRQAAQASLDWTASRVREDGSWPYGETPGTAWIDGFHTGYVLDALRAARVSGCVDVRADVLERGLRFYRSALFLDDGTPRYAAQSTYPIDIQCVAQGIQTLSLAASDDPTALAGARRVHAFAERRMSRGDGAYRFQLRRLWTNPVPHVRWGAAPMLLALAHLHEAEEATR